MAAPSFGGKGLGHDTDQVAFAGAISASYAVPLVVGALDVGLAGSWSPVGYLNTRNGGEEQTQLVGGYATAGVRFPLGESVSLGPSLALGVVWWSGISNDNIFTSSHAGTGGPVPMPSLRIGLALLWRAGEHLLVGLEPAWSFSKTTVPDLSERVSNLRWLMINGVIGVAL